MTKAPPGRGDRNDFQSQARQDLCSDHSNPDPNNADHTGRLGVVSVKAAGL